MRTSIDPVERRVAAAPAQTISPERAASFVASDMWLDYGSGLSQPDRFDRALAARVHEVSNVKIQCAHGTQHLRQHRRRQRARGCEAQGGLDGPRQAPAIARKLRLLRRLSRLRLDRAVADQTVRVGAVDSEKIL